ncbi:MAG: GNAT family N-acetyltransferase [Thiobacillaceae bacterium]|nr:GNAT family N-acetyltransferase [Thiobacillaceae bacterium]
MRHELALAGEGFRLRPVGDEDADLIVQLRNDPQRARYLHPGVRTRAEQLAWLAAYYDRPGDYYFAIERRGLGQTEGFAALYDVDEHMACAEWGRWILRPGSLAAVESAYLIYRIAFDHLGLRRVYCRTVAENAAVVAFHDRMGLDRRVLPAWFDFEGRRMDAVEHTLEAAQWLRLAPMLQAQCARIARKLG